MYQPSTLRDLDLSKWFLCWYGIYMGKAPYICGMVCVGGMVREKHSMWYGTLAVWYDGTVPLIYQTAKFPWWYGMFQYIKSVRVEYVVRISYVTTLFTNHWKLFENIRDLYGYPSVHGASFSNRKSYGPVPCGLKLSETLRCGSVRFSGIVNPTVRFGAVIKNRKSYGAVRYGFQIW